MLGLSLAIRAIVEAALAALPDQKRKAA